MKMWVSDDPLLFLYVILYQNILKMLKKSNKKQQNMGTQ